MVIAAAGAWGCSALLNWSQDGQPCDSQGRCLSGYTCVAGKCQPGTAGPDASVPDAGPGPGDAGCASDAGIAQDPRNCGACGHDCAGGGCAAGRCTPYALASASWAFNLGLDRGAVIWDVDDAVAVDGGIFRTAVDGSSQTALVSGRRARPLVVLDGGVYWSAPPLGIWRVDAAGGPLLPLETALSADAFGSDADFLYWSSVVAPSTTYLYQWALDGGQSATVVAIDSYPTSGIGTDDTNLYWMNALGHLLYEPKSQPLTTPHLLLTGVGAMAVTSTQLYYGTLSPADGGVWALGLPLLPDGGAGPSTLLAATDFPTSINVDALGLYWTTASAVVWLAWDGGLPTVLSGRASPNQVTSDGQALYWTEYSADGGLYRWMR